MILTAVYDLRLGPISYDFVTWLARARLEQQRLGAERLHVVLIPDTGGLGNFARCWGPHDADQTRWRLWQIVIPACALADATITLAPSRDPTLSDPFWFPAEKSHFLGPLVDAARAGESIPQLKPTRAALKYAQRWITDTRTVTLTLRNNNPHDGRDSSPAWMEFARWLRKSGFTPLVIPDTADTLRDCVGSLPGLSIDLRAALYASAAMNCFCHNGPMVLAWHIGAPYLAFNSMLPEDRWREHWRIHLRLNRGDQLPWVTERQRLVYRADTIDVLTEEFGNVMGTASDLCA